MTSLATSRDTMWRSGLWSRDRATYRALNAMSRRRGPTPPYTYAGRRVTRGSTRLPYGRSSHARGFLTHVVEGVYMAWMAGELAGTMVRWRCGPMTDRFRLLDEPSSPLCPVCMITRPWMEVA